MPEHDQVLEILLTLLKTQNIVLRHAPVSILFINHDGKILLANQSAKQSLGFDPVNKSIQDIFEEKVARRRLKNILKALNTGEVVVDRDERDLRHFITQYHPITPLRICAAVATEITREVRIQNALRILEVIKGTVINVSNLKDIAKKVGLPLLKIEGVSHVRVELLNGGSPVVWEKGEPAQYKVSIPLVVLGEKAGGVTLSLKREMLEEEKSILQAGLDDVMYYIRIREFEKALARNVSEIARIVDGIRNPLTAIILTVEISNSNVYEKVKAQVERITKLLDSLDERWGESERILGVLKKLQERV